MYDISIITYSRRAYNPGKSDGSGSFVQAADYGLPVRPPLALMLST